MKKTTNIVVESQIDGISRIKLNEPSTYNALSSKMLESLINIFKSLNFILIVHNDPRNLKGSKTVKERIKLLNLCKKIYFVSSWVEEKFFEGIDKNHYKNYDILYISVNPLKLLRDSLPRFS